MLLFKAHLLPLITSGKKRQTIRLWKSPRVRLGQLAYSPGLGRLLITAIDTLPNLNALTTADAHADGFPSKKALLEEIHRLYNPLPKNRQIYRIQFTYPAPIPPIPQTSPTTPPKPTRKKPQKTTPPKPHPRHPTKTATPHQRQTLHHYLTTLPPNPPSKISNFKS